MVNERLRAIENLLEEILNHLSPHFKKMVKEAINIYVDARIAAANTLR